MRTCAVAMGLMLGLLACAAPEAHAQRSLNSAPALASLDLWLIMRLGNAQLIPDTTRASRTAHARTAMPRVESVSVGARMDTLFAVQYGPTMDLPTLPVGSTVQLASPTGAVSTVGAEVIARRAFRAPRHPRAINDRDYRYGWAYVALVRNRASMSSTVFRGWVFVQVPDTTRSR